MATKRKVRRYDNGGDIREGRHSGIDDDTRARAMAWLAKQSAGDKEVETPKAAPKVAPRVAPSESSAETRRLARSAVSLSPDESSAEASRLARRAISQSPDESSAETSRLAARNALRTAPATRASVDQIPGVSASTARNAAAGERLGRQPSEAERLAKNALYSSPGGSRTASALGRFGKGLTELLQSGRAGWRAGVKEKKDERAATRASAKQEAEARPRMDEEAPAPIIPKMPARARNSERVRSYEEDVMAGEGGPNFRKGGKVKRKSTSMPKLSSASKRGDGIAQRGKTRGRFV